VALFSLPDHAHTPIFTRVNFLLTMGWEILAQWPGDIARHGTYRQDFGA